jgi:hypothetical protein
VLALRRAHREHERVPIHPLNQLRAHLPALVDLNDDLAGVMDAHGVDGGIAVVTAELVRVSAALAWTLTLAGLTLTQAPGTEEGVAYHTGTGTAEILLVRGTA